MSRSMGLKKRAAVGAIAAAVLCLAAHGANAQAGEGQGENHGVIILKGDGGQEIHLDVQDPGAKAGQFVVMAINGDGHVFSFAGNPADLPFGGSLGPIGMAAMMAGGVNSSFNIIDPGVSYIYDLIKRSDVRSDLFLESKQREQIEQMLAQESQASQFNVGQIQQSIQANGGAPNAALEDRAKRLKDLAAGGSGSIGDREKKLAAILTAKQIKRLKELDLQYRGPLAMGVKPVAEKAKLTETQAPAVTELLKKYHEAVRKALGVEQKVTRTENPGGGTSVSISSSSSNFGSPDEMKAKLEKAHEEIEKIRKQLGAETLKQLQDPQTSEWKNLPVSSSSSYL